jgi:hypothetical protein
MHLSNCPANNEHDNMQPGQCNCVAFLLGHIAKTREMVLFHEGSEVEISYHVDKQVIIHHSDYSELCRHVKILPTGDKEQ